jgi:hypothetical protein
MAAKRGFVVALPAHINWFLIELSCDGKQGAAATSAQKGALTVTYCALPNNVSTACMTNV